MMLKAALPPALEHLRPRDQQAHKTLTPRAPTALCTGCLSAAHCSSDWQYIRGVNLRYSHRHIIKTTTNVISNWLPVLCGVAATVGEESEDNRLVYSQFYFCFIFLRYEPRQNVCAEKIKVGFFLFAVLIVFLIIFV